MTITTSSNSHYFGKTLESILTDISSLVWTVLHLLWSVNYWQNQQWGTFQPKYAYKVILDKRGECLLTNTHVSQLLHELGLSRVQCEALLGTKIT